MSKYFCIKYEQVFIKHYLLYNRNKIQMEHFLNLSLEAFLNTRSTNTQN